MPETQTAPNSDAAGTSPTTFSEVGALLSRPDVLAEWLIADTDRARRADLFKEAFSCVVQISAQTGWSEDTALENLGCNTKTEESLANLTEERLRKCISYMLWVASLLELQDLETDKRTIVRRAARFFVAAGRDLARIEETMEQGEFTPLAFLSLGETARAFTVARQQLGEPGGDRTGRVHEQNPFVDASSPHLSPERVAKLNRPDAERLLGANVARRMREHLSRCGICETPQEVDSALEPPPAEPTPA
jgi:hypothetical protein